MIKTKLSLSKANVNYWPYIFCIPFVLCYLIFSLFPTLFSIGISMTNWTGFGDKTFIGLKNYINLFTKDKLFIKAFGNTFLLMGISVPVQLFFGIIMAQVLFNIKRCKSVLQTIGFLPYIIPAVAAGFIFAYIFDRDFGYINQIFVQLGIWDEGRYFLQRPGDARLIVALIEIWKYSGYCMVIYIAGMASVPEEIYEAARIDGSSGIHAFIKITIPMIRNTTVFLVTTSVIHALQLFDAASMIYSGQMGNPIIGGPEYSVFTVVWKFVDDAFGSNSRMGYGAAESTVLFVVIVIMSLLSYRISIGKENS